MLLGSARLWAASSLMAGLCALAFPASAEPVARDKVLAALPELEKLAEAAIARGDVPGLAIAVVQGEDIVYLKGFGVREAGKPEAVGPDTVFQLASFSKPISATIAAAVVSEGDVAWDTKIADIDPGFRLASAYPSTEVTVEDLFNHRSGLPGGAGNELEELGFDQAEILHRLRLVPLDGFRSHYSYSNFGITEGAVAVAKSVGTPWPDLAEQKLFRPLGMNSTSSRYADFLARPDRASLHVKMDGAWTALAVRAPDAQTPAAGVSSSARDLTNWLKLEIANGKFGGRQLISADALAATHRPLIDRGVNPVTGSRSFYGLGWNVEFGRHGLLWGHAGAFSHGARTLVSILPEQELGIVVLTNAFPSGLPEGLADSFFDQALDGKVEKDWITPWDAIYAGLFGPAIEAGKARFAAAPQPPMPALPLSAYAGQYRNDYVGAVNVVERGDGLVVRLGPDGRTEWPLRPFYRDVFTTAPYAEMPDFSAAVSFAIGSDGKAGSITLEPLDDLGLGTLKRAE